MSLRLCPQAGYENINAGPERKSTGKNKNLRRDVLREISAQSDLKEKISASTNKRGERWHFALQGIRGNGGGKRGKGTWNPL